MKRSSMMIVLALAALGAKKSRGLPDTGRPKYRAAMTTMCSLARPKRQTPSAYPPPMRSGRAKPRNDYRS